LQFEPPGGVTVELTGSSACPVLSLGSSLEECVPARRRRQLRRAIAAAQRRGAMEIVDASHDPQGFLDHLFALHAARWQGRGEEGVLADPAIQAFHREAIEGLAGNGIARCRLLRIAGTIAGVWYGFAGRERVLAYLGGFDPDFAEESPGSILTGDAIGEAIATGAKEFDFLRRREDYKYKWGAVDRMNRRMVFTRRCAA
jgi:CelD/BcsL family acetyltransferase involved in cellulose biosynthesis